MQSDKPGLPTHPEKAGQQQQQPQGGWGQGASSAFAWMQQQENLSEPILKDEHQVDGLAPRPQAAAD